MALAVPKYLQTAKIQDAKIHYKWDDWNVEQAEESIDEDFYSRLEGISQRANIAFTLGTSEWVVHRFGTLNNEPLPFQYIEAAWAQIVDWRYESFKWEEYAENYKWSGPVMGPIWIAMTRIMYVILEAKEDNDPETIASWITNLAQYIMTDPAPYLEWRERIMERFETLYPRNPDETLGEVVPREALDPDFDFKLEMTEELINKFLAGLNYRTNPFLNSPEVMLEQGFKGTPYKFDIEKDRKDRFEW